MAFTVHHSLSVKVEMIGRYRVGTIFVASRAGDWQNRSSGSRDRRTSRGRGQAPGAPSCRLQLQLQLLKYDPCENNMAPRSIFSHACEGADTVYEWFFVFTGAGPAAVGVRRLRTMIYLWCNVLEGELRHVSFRLREVQ